MTQLGVAPGVPTPGLVATVEDVLGQRACGWRKPHSGLTPAQRFVVTLADHSSVFVKAAVDSETEQQLRTDYLVMSTLRDLVPEVIAWTEADGRPVLVLEDLSDGHWPADHFRTENDERKPVWWKPGHLDLLFAALDRLADIPAPSQLAPLATVYESHWVHIASRAEPVLALGLFAAPWLEGVLPDLVSAEATLDLSGDALVHNDVRSDNVCFRGDRVILVDWSNSRRGQPHFDLANLVQGLPLEGGPDPFDVVPTGGSFAAWRAGELLRRASNDDGSAPGWLTRVFLRMALIDLDWAGRCLGLPPRAGVDWRSI